MMERYFALAIALIRAREAGDVITDEGVLSECVDQGVDPGPVMILVQGKAPCQRWGFIKWWDGETQFVPYRGDVYFPLDEPVYTNTPEMTEALALRREALAMEV